MKITMMVKRFTLTLMLLLAFSSQASAGALAGGATEVTQIANNVQLAKTVIELDRQLRVMRRIYNDAKSHAEGLVSYNWGNAAHDLEALAEAVRFGQSVAYSGGLEEQKMRHQYQGYDEYLARQGMTDSSTLSDRYREWSRTNRDTVLAAVRSIKEQGRQLEDENASIDMLERLSETSHGRLKAIQVGHQISMQQVRQLQKLRSLLMTQIQLKTSLESSRRAKEDLVESNTKKYTERPMGVILGDGLRL